jgi:hypothetical protein
MSKQDLYRQWQPPVPSEGGGGVGWIILLCILWTIFAPVPGPVDDFIVWAFGAYSAMRGL